MKKHTQLLSPLVVTLVSLLFAGMRTNAQTAADDATGYTGWGTGTNLGTGFLPWALANNNGSGGGFGGNFISSSGTAIDTSSKAFGLYANQGTGEIFSVAYRSLSNGLTPGSVFRAKLANSDIATGGFMGVALRSSTNLSTTTNEDFITESDTAFAFYFNGGANNYLIWDGTGVEDSGIPFTHNGLSLEIAPLAGNNYRLVVKSADGNTTLQTYSPALLAGNAGGGTPINTFAGFNFHTGGGQNFYFNQLNVSSTSLIPPTFANVSPANGALYVLTTNAISFEVDSAFSTVATNGITVSLNGTNITNLFFAGTATNRLVTTASNVLAPNLVYTNVIVATDGNGNKATNTTTFNTWGTNLLFVEAEDYNFNGGGFISGGSPSGNITPNQYGVQSGFPLSGTNGIDYFKPTPNDGGSNTYRPGDQTYVDLDAPPVSADVDHNAFTNNNYTDYNLSFVEANEWENYTRSFSSNLSYNVYARMASLSANPVMEIDHDASGTATTTNQPLIPLGTAICPQNTGGGQSYAMVPLTDFFSQPVQVRFNGNNTLRCKRIGGGYNFNYLVFVPSASNTTLRPYISFGFPFPNATGVALDTAISFNLAHRQTSVTNSNIHLSLNSVDVTGSLVISNNAAGAVVTYQPPSLLPGNATNTLIATYTDSASVTQTNTWTFSTENPPVVPTSYAQASPGTSRGFTIHIAKAVDNAPATLFTPTVARAEAQLLGPLVDTNSQSYGNIALNNGQAVETNVINYDIDAQSFGTFGGNVAFPDVPAALTNNYIAMEALMYVPLSNGIYTFAVNSDDGFKFTTGPTPANTNTTLGLFDGDRAPSESTFDFIIQTNGYYPMRLLYYQGVSGGNVELYSVNRTNGTRILLNNPTNGSAFAVYQLASGPGPISITRSGTNVVLNWSGSHTLQSATLVNSTNSGFTDVPGPVLTGPYTNALSGTAKYYRLKN